MRDPCELHEPEAALALRAALAPPFTALRRILVQLCGLMLLSGGQRLETQDGIAVSLAALRPEIAEAIDALRRAGAGRRRGAVRRERLLAAAADIEAARSALEGALAMAGDSRGKSGRALALLRRAQRRMLAASDDRAGLAMVGFSRACCCAPAPQAASLACR